MSERRSWHGQPPAAILGHLLVAVGAFCGPGPHLRVGKLLDHDGEVDPERVAEAVAALADAKPYLLKPRRGTAPGGFGQGRRTPVDSASSTSWGEVLRGR